LDWQELVNAVRHLVYQAGINAGQVIAITQQLPAVVKPVVALANIVHLIPSVQLKYLVPIAH
jgi:hypothetical protein